ncbi:MAG: hypothetical protein AAGL34_01720 [Bacteroidota bacterium]
MKKKAIRILLVLLSTVIALLLYIVLEDMIYDDFKMDTGIKEDRKALLITWEAEDQNTFWKHYEEEIFPTLNALYGKGMIHSIFPFDHQPLGYQNSKLQWTNCLVLLLDREYSSSDIQSSILSSIKSSSLSDQFRAMDLMRLQRGLNMFYPIKNGIKRAPRMQQHIEYVFSNSEARERYYNDQYQFSGPAMQDLHSRDKAGRFIGFELEERIASAENMPKWDVIHIIGFTNWQSIKALPFFHSTWNKHAEIVYGKGMTMKKKVAEWERIRTNVKSTTKQNFKMTRRKN